MEMQVPKRIVIRLESITEEQKDKVKRAIFHCWPLPSKRRYIKGQNPNN